MTNLSFSELFKTIQHKISTKEEGSYSNHLAQGGVEKVTRKIGEEAVEVVIAAFLHEKKNDEKTRQELIGEVCDLFYHNFVLLAKNEISLDEILEELNKRNSNKK